VIEKSFKTTHHKPHQHIIKTLSLLVDRKEGLYYYMAKVSSVVFYLFLLSSLLFVLVGCDASLIEEGDDGDTTTTTTTMSSKSTTVTESGSTVPFSSDLQARIKELFGDVTKSQFKKDKPYKPPFDLYEQSGVYPSWIHVNLVGDPELAFARNVLSVLDDNMFVTAFIEQVLLEASQFEVFSAVADSKELNHQLELALGAIASYAEKSLPTGTITRVRTINLISIYLHLHISSSAQLTSTHLMNSNQLITNFHSTSLTPNQKTFWPEFIENGTYVTQPVNIHNIIESETSLSDYFEKILDDLGQQKLWDRLAPILLLPSRYLSAFFLPRY